MSSRKFLGLALAGLTVLTAPFARASTVEGADIFVATDGDVFATYRGNTASYSNDLYLDNPNPDLFIFNNHNSVVGSTVDLGFYTAGTELFFRLHVNNTGDDFYTGAASLNADNHTHARVTYPDVTYPGETLVEFEDLNGGPYDYNDLSFTFSNVRPTKPTDPNGGSVPDGASTLGLVAASLAGLVQVKRRLNRR